MNLSRSGRKTHMAHSAFIARINAGDGKFPFVNVQFSKNHRPIPTDGETYYLRPSTAVTPSSRSSAGHWFDSWPKSWRSVGSTQKRTSTTLNPFIFGGSKLIRREPTMEGTPVHASAMNSELTQRLLKTLSRSLPGLRLSHDTDFVCVGVRPRRRWFEII